MVKRILVPIASGVTSVLLLLPATHLAIYHAWLTATPLDEEALKSHQFWAMLFTTAVFLLFITCIISIIFLVLSLRKKKDKKETIQPQNETTPQKR